jgi:uncharacterized protein YndB with AHSA1/START domain
MTSRVFVALRVPAAPARAFEAFTREIACWWRSSPLFRITPQGDGELVFEPGVGGRLVTRLGNGDSFEIGRISVWEPGKRLVFTWRQASFAAESDHHWCAAIRHGCDSMEPHDGSGPPALAAGIVGTKISDGYLAEV